jgi:hypothetical protein
MLEKKLLQLTTNYKGLIVLLMNCFNGLFVVSDLERLLTTSDYNKELIWQLV